MNVQARIKVNNNVKVQSSVILNSPKKYEGDYIVTPTKEMQILNTSYSMLKDNITINPIPNEFIIPTGTEEIVVNGEYDITDKSKVKVNVKSETYFVIDEDGILSVENGELSVDENGVLSIGGVKA